MRIIFEGVSMGVKIGRPIMDASQVEDDHVSPHALTQDATVEQA